MLYLLHMNIFKKLFGKLSNAAKDQQSKAAQKTMMEELFNDFYIRRKDVYKMNFVRGIFFGLGSALGGTLVIALLLWILSLFVNFPLIGEYFQTAQDSIDRQ